MAHLTNEPVGQAMYRTSIVIPVRNEAEVIASTLHALKAWRAAGHEIVVVDGGSTDQTPTIAAPLCDRMVRTIPGRATQMNAGAAAAGGDLLVFLHADTRLPRNSQAELGRIAGGDRECWGRFDVRLDAHPTIYRVIETLMNWRSRWSGIATGDQTIFVARTLFERCGGYPPIALMEDIALCLTLRSEMAPICLKSKVVTSARRWQNNGVVTTVIQMWWLRVAFFFGVSAERLRAAYERSDTTIR